MRRIVEVGLVALLLVATAVAVWYWQQGQKARTMPDRLTLYGNIDVRLVNLAFDAQGRIAQMEAAEGVSVKEGEVLARLAIMAAREILAFGTPQEIKDRSGREGASAKTLKRR